MSFLSDMSQYSDKVFHYLFNFRQYLTVCPTIFYKKLWR